MMKRCVQCGGEFLGGEPMHEMTVGNGNGSTRIDFFCADCIDYVSSAMWNDEEWGPYPARVYRSGKDGHA